jgi:hypothetical protein
LGDLRKIGDLDLPPATTCETPHPPAAAVAQLEMLEFTIERRRECIGAESDLAAANRCVIAARIGARHARRQIHETGTSHLSSTRTLISKAYASASAPLPRLPKPQLSLEF